MSDVSQSPLSTDLALSCPLPEMYKASCELQSALFWKTGVLSKFFFTFWPCGLWKVDAKSFPVWSCSLFYWRQTAVDGPKTLWLFPIWLSYENIMTAPAETRDILHIHCSAVSKHATMIWPTRILTRNELCSHFSSNDGFLQCKHYIKSMGEKAWRLILIIS